MKDYINSSPHFFRIIKIAFSGGLVVLLGLAFFIDAPLQGPADISRVPNPSKSAWFLMWTQEVVSYSSNLVYLILALALIFLFLPWLPLSPPAERARWFSREQWGINILTIVSFGVILCLTIVAMYFRGENWSFIFGF